jgi:hypothetical protein
MGQQVNWSSGFSELTSGPIDESARDAPKAER